MDIVLSNISKSFGDKIVLRNFSHTFVPGEITCLLGASGCGKTTLLKLICGLISADSGEISGNGCHFSMVFQENRLFDNLSAEKNVLLTAKKGFSRTNARELLAKLGINNPGEKTGSFSGGMKRRVAIARALAAEYDVLLLDEPMTGLDSETRLRCLSLIKKMTAGKTVICVTHQAEDAAILGGQVLHLQNS